MKKSLDLLGGITVNAFLRDYWQKKPLLIRQAVPQFNGLLDLKQLIALVCDQDAQARMVTQRRGLWQLHQAPFEPKDFDSLGKVKWTVLLQGLNHYLPEGAELLKQFNFIPHARLDDLMVSYAPKGGGVGPHFDAYDVFLLQGMGHRRWQISTQADRTLIEGAPLRILKDFKVEQEWVLEPGDMLYLPPHCAHNGIAEDECMTYSIGFRTPSYQELVEQFLVYLQDRICVDGVYADPELKTQLHPSEIGADMLNQVERAVRKVEWGKPDIAGFLGSQFGHWFGGKYGTKLFSREKSRFFNTEKIRSAEKYMAKYGVGKAIILGRFIPVVRGLINPLAGMVHVPVRTFTKWNLIGSLLWTQGFIWGGYVVGNTFADTISKYITWIILVIAGVTVIPLGVEILKEWRSRKHLS